MCVSAYKNDLMFANEQLTFGRSWLMTPHSRVRSRSFTYTYIYMCECVCLYIYIYIYMYHNSTEFAEYVR